MTFNSLNKWAVGISDTLALGLLNEALGLDVTVLAALCVKEELRRRPVYAKNMKLLDSAGVAVIDSSDLLLRPGKPDVTLDWTRIIPR